MDEATTTELEYLRLRSDMLEQVDRDMFGWGMAAGAACGRADEAFGAARDALRRSILLGVLGRRDRKALARWEEENAAVRRWVESAEFEALPQCVREWVVRDLRLAETPG